MMIESKVGGSIFRAPICRSRFLRKGMGVVGGAIT
jgi:hypothetical protein